MKNYYHRKNIFITGGAGTVGKALIKRLLDFNPGKIISVDNNETETFFLMEQYKKFSNFHCFICDIRDKEKLSFLMQDCDYVFHGAALKHVILGEYNPFDIVQTNLVGLQNVIESSIRCKVKKVLFMSSDKAVNPTNAMGASKLMGEKLITASNNIQNLGGTVFCSTRFGNVLGSRGSVVPIFINQLKKGLDLTITDENMTRFIMKTEDAVNLILESLKIAKGGEIFILKMDSVKISDLAYSMIEGLSSIFNSKKVGLTNIGCKPGEKLFEELLSGEEVQRTIELELLYVLLPVFKPIYFNNDYYDEYKGNKITKPIISNNVKFLSKNEIIKKYVTYIKEKLDEF